MVRQAHVTKMSAKMSYHTSQKCLIILTVAERHKIPIIADEVYADIVSIPENNFKF